jgi:hypothetical protein
MEELMKCGGAAAKYLERAFCSLIHVEFHLISL